MPRRTSGVDLEYRARLDKFKKDLEQIPGLTKKNARAMTTDWVKSQREMSKRARKEAREAAQAWETATGELRAGFAQLVPGLEPALEGVSALGSGLGLLGGALAIGGTVAGMVALSASVAEANRELIRLSEESGVSTTTVQALQFALDAAGRDSGNLDGALEDLGERMVDAASGSGEAAEAFDRLGVRATDASGKLRPSEEVLRDVIGALQRLPEGAERSALATAALGDSMRGVAQALGDTDLGAFEGFVERFGADVGPEAIQRTREWQGNLAALRVVFGGIIDDLNDMVGGGGLLQGFTNGVIASVAFVKEMSEQTARWREEKEAIDAALVRGDIGLTNYHSSLFAAYNVTGSIATATQMARIEVENFEQELAKMFGTLKDGEEGAGDGITTPGFFTPEAAPDKDDPDPASRAREIAQATKQLDNLLRQSLQAQLEGEDLIQAKLADRLLQIGELAIASGDQLTAQMAATEAIAVAEQELADLREKNHEQELERRKEVMAAAWALAGSVTDSFRFIADMQGKAAEDGNDRALKAARAWFAAYKVGAIAQAIIQTQLAIGQAMQSVPYPANIVVAAAAGAEGALRVATIAAQKPSFHSGGVMMTDERAATLRAGEGVITPEAIAALGRLNRGETPSGGGQTVAVYGHRLFDTIQTDRARVPTSAASRLRRRASRTRPGRSTHFAR
jgi:hypothetical protein